MPINVKMMNNALALPAAPERRELPALPSPHCPPPPIGGRPPPTLMTGGSLLGGGQQLGRRVPNFPSHYLSALDSAGSFEASPLADVSGSQSMTPLSPANGSTAADAFLSNATIVTSNASSASAVAPPAASVAASAVTTASAPPPEVVITSPKSCGGEGGKPRLPRKDRRHSLPTSIVLSPSQLRRGGCDLPPSHPVPEFLCHLYSMLCDPTLSDLIGWIVPAHDETTDLGGGRAGIGKIVVHDPTRLQNEVLGKYYRHSKYSSFQRQLNYFGFKKRLHGSKKGKMCPCSFVHDQLGQDPQSLLNLKRRPPSGKRVGSEPNTEKVLDKNKYQLGATSIHTIKMRPQKERGSGGIPCNISLPSIDPSTYHPVVTSPANLNTAASCNSSITCIKNEPWCMSQASVPGPLNLPIMAQAATAFPGKSLSSSPWLTSSNSLLPVPPNPLYPKSANSTTNLMSRAVRVENKVSVLRANSNAAVLEAKKSLELNFLKSQRERRAAGAVAPMAQRPPPVQKNVAVVQQPMMAPNRFPSALVPRVMDGASASGRLPMRPQAPSAEMGLPPPVPPTTTKDWMGHAVLKSTLPASTASFSTNFSMPPQADNFLGHFTSKVPLVVENNTINSAAGADYKGLYINNLTGPGSINGNNNNSNRGPLVATVTTTSYKDHPQGTTEPPTQFNDLLSNLLSTALPPSEELFDDDMSVGNFSDFGEGALQVADDGMLLP